MAEPDTDRTTSDIVARAWSDPDFKARLVSDPAAVLAEEGIAVQEGTELRVVENTDSIRHFVLPAHPGDEQLADAVLERVSGGMIDPEFGLRPARRTVTE